MTDHQSSSPASRPLADLLNLGGQNFYPDWDEDSDGLLPLAEWLIARGVTVAASRAAPEPSPEEPSMGQVAKEWYERGLSNGQVLRSPEDREPSGPWRLSVYRDATADKYGVATDERYIGIGSSEAEALAVRDALNRAAASPPPETQK